MSDEVVRDGVPRTTGQPPAQRRRHLLVEDPTEPDGPAITGAHDHHVRLGALVDAVDDTHACDGLQRSQLCVVVDIRMLAFRAAAAAATDEDSRVHGDRIGPIPIQCYGGGVTSRSAALLAVLVPSLLLAACGDDGTDPDTADTAGGLGVVAAFYPLAEAARGVGGDLVTVTDLTPPGQGPHDLELQPQQAATIEQADVALYLGRGFQPQVEDAVAGAPDGLVRVDLLDHVALLPVDPQLEGTQGEVDGEVLAGDVDPHVWLDPARMIEMVGTITDTFAAADPDHADDYRANAAQYLTGLTGLDDEYRTGLADCRSDVVVTSHRAFGYLADTYGLRQIPIAGISPEIEPDPRTLEAIAAEAEAEGVTTIFLESVAPPDLARTVADEIGAELDLLDPIEGLTQEQLDDGVTYASIMRDNLARLRTGLDCA